MKLKYNREETTKRSMLTLFFMGLVPLLILGVFLCIIQYSTQCLRRREQLARQAESISTYFETFIGSLETISVHYSANYGQLSDSRIPQQLSTYQEIYTLPGDLYFYRHGMPAIYSVKEQMPYAVFEQTLVSPRELDGISFFTLINSVTSARFYSSLDFSGKSNYFVALVPVPYMDSEPIGTLINIVPLQTLNAVVSDYLGSQDYLYSLQDSSGRTVFYSQRGTLPDEKAARAAILQLNGTGDFPHRIAGRPLWLNREISNRNYKYVCASPTASLYAEANHQLLRMIALLSAFLALDILLSVLLSRYQMRPLHALYEQLRQDESFESSWDIVDQLSSCYEDINRKNARLLSQINSYTVFVRARVLNDLLHGRITDLSELDSVRLIADIRFDYALFFVICLRLQPQDDREDPLAAALPLLEEIRLPSAYAYGVEGRTSGVVCIIFNAQRMNRSDDALRHQALDRLYTLLADIPVSTIAAGVSAVHDSPLRLNRALLEANAALPAEGGIQLYPVASTPQVDDFHEEQELLRQSLLSGDADLAQQLLQQLFDRLHQFNASDALAQRFGFSTIMVVLDAARRQNIQIDQLELSLAVSRGDMAGLHQLLSTAALKLCQCRNEAEQRAQAQMNNAVCQYLYAHFGDSTLTVEQMAESLSISPSYARKLVKDATGTSFSNYLTVLRFNRIKQQLAATSLPIQEIVKSAGYVDISSFNRKFKQKEGMTPGQYRALYHEDV